MPGGWAWGQPPAKLLAQGQNLLPETRRPLLGRLHAALQFGVLPNQPAVAELQVLQTAEQVGWGRPAGREGPRSASLAQATFPRWWWGDVALLEKEKQGRLPSYHHSPCPSPTPPRTPSPAPGPGAAGRAGKGLRIGTAQVWGLPRRSFPGWLCPQLLGILKGDRQRCGLPGGLLRPPPSSPLRVSSPDPAAATAPTPGEASGSLWSLELRLDLLQGPRIYQCPQPTSSPRSSATHLAAVRPQLALNPQSAGAQACPQAQVLAQASPFSLDPHHSLLPGFLSFSLSLLSLPHPEGSFLTWS